MIVDNALPSLSITKSWWIWETANAAVYESIIPLGSISITVECGDLPDRVVDYNPTAMLLLSSGTILQRD